MKKYGKYILGLVILVLVIGLGFVAYTINNVSNKETEKLSQRNDDLAFMSDRDGHWDIFMINPADEITNVTGESGTDNYFPNFTFDSTIINFYAIDDSAFKPAIVKPEGSDYRAMSFAESGVYTLTSGQINLDPTWSQDSEKLLWVYLNVSFSSFNSEVYLSDADGGNEQNLTDDGGNDIMPAWSPDGTQVVFISDRNEKQDVYILDLESGEQTRLTGDEGWDFQAVWSLDGSQILFVSDRDDELIAGELKLYLIDVATQEVRAFAEDDVFKGDPTYSPDGSTIAYMSNESGSWHIYLMDADGENVRQITDGDSNNLFPVWRPVPLSGDEEEATANPDSDGETPE